MQYNAVPLQHLKANRKHSSEKPPPYHTITSIT